MLTICDLSISVEEKSIIRGIRLSIDPGTLHVLMGPNGSGKSTLAYALMGYPLYQITAGSIVFQGQVLNEYAIDKRAKAGIFLAFQHPVEIPGVTVFNFLKEAHYAFCNTVISVEQFKTLLYEKMAFLKLDIEFSYRPLNYGFSGGEKKKLELLQLLLLKPKMAILDEIDSGLDVDAIKIVAEGLHHARRDNPDLAVLMITHYPRLFDYLTPDAVHIMNKGQLVKTGGPELMKAIEQGGYHEIGGT